MQKHSSSFAIIVNQDNKALFLLRDNNPHIPNPNTWSLIGGAAEEGETAEETLIREVLEETNLKIDSKGLIFLDSLKSLETNKFRRLFFTKISRDQENTIKLGNEGQKLQFFTLVQLGMFI